MKKIVLLVVLLSTSFYNSYSQRWLWATDAETLCDNWGLAIDSKNNAYITGSYYDTARFQNIFLQGGANQGFLVKYDGNGNVKWGITSEGSNSLGFLNSIEATCDHSNNVIICGGFTDTVRLGVDTLRSLPNHAYGNAFFAKFDSAGSLLWARQSYSPPWHDNSAEAWSVNVDKFNNIYIVGTYVDTISFGSDTFRTASWDNSFLAKCDPAGNIQWVSSSHAPSPYCEADGWSSTLDDSGNIYIAGFFCDTITFGRYTLMANYNSIYNTTFEAFLVKYDKNGNVLWAWQSKGNDSTHCVAFSVLTDKANNVYITGAIYDSAYFGPYKLRGNSTSPQNGEWGDIYLAKFSPDGQLQWVHQSQSDSGGWSGYSLQKDTLNNIYISGGGSNNGARSAHVSFAGVRFTIPGTSGSEPSFIMKLDTSGNALCYSMVTGGGEDKNSIISSPAGDYIYLFGSVYGTSIFGTDTLTSAEQYPFLARWESCQCTHGDIRFMSHDTVCSNSGAVQIYATPQGGVLKGSGVYGNYFYPDSVTSNKYHTVHYHFVDSSGCHGSLTDSIYVSSCLGIPDVMNGARFSVYPNPSNGNFFMEVNSEAGTVNNIEVINELGQVIYFKQYPVVTTQYTIDLSHLPTGVYTLRLQTNSGSIVKKLVVVKR
ncbi:MAG TPA: T9SS type A sorting domain-containing protein [Bacteroidia bacterium]|jgi:hypothetical protein|nr:T9SS type A sorting domain-containing protein [Bacteroidia bacterium]